ncbi:hypothetical protein BCR34DRAFT_623673 [Clohesyomyces aquaticus]|uniref:C2H2-type domain-containing protein n=1 Tax=Clohesyomyces aquaticus TaxID=1231657 RepID=A0A1Y1ZTY7_9PLEO|nr:hypothetical protein BCR34DRAFT_623673 [Clohesyomyces aquaticus]
MDGKNSSGRRISLLNDNPEPPHHPVRLSSYPSSRTSSYTSSPVGSPPAPRLVRSDSSDSTDMQTPSPITPDFAFEGLSQTMDSPDFSQTFFPSQKELASAYPPIPHASGSMPYAANAPQTAYFRPQQGSESGNTSASANPRSKKNSYPCPMAKSYNCNDYFTTSGHAARHAKKHTGKKDAFCPECNKAFTRKDNMEQHRRTHQSGRNTTKGTDDRAKKAKQPAKRPKPGPIQPSVMPSLNPPSMVDPALPASPTSSNFSLAPAVQPVDCFGAEYSQRSPYPDPTAYSMTTNFSLGSSYGLDALAIAASSEKRKYEA